MRDYRDRSVDGRPPPLLRLEPSVASPEEGDGDIDDSPCFGSVFRSPFFSCARDHHRQEPRYIRVAVGLGSTRAPWPRSSRPHQALVYQYLRRTSEILCADDTKLRLDRSGARKPAQTALHNLYWAKVLTQQRSAAYFGCRGSIANCTPSFSASRCPV